MLIGFALALAQDAVSLEYVKKGQVGTAKPSFTVIANAAADDLTVKASCGGVSMTRSGPAGAGERKTWEIDVGEGTHTCTGQLSVATPDGETGEMPLKFTVQVLPRLRMSLVSGSLDLAARTLSVTMDRPASRVEVSIFGPGGAEIGGGLTPSSAGAGQAVSVGWSQDSAEALKLKLRGYDENGFFAELELNPWRYSIPHEDVVFATNSAVIDGPEVPKLEAAMVEVQNTLAKYGKDVVIKLYVAGHTDTVGDAGRNDALSVERAKSIATWFSRSGFPGSIYYTGLGERDLAVATADSVDEPKNRRAVYTLAASAPDLPGSAAWVMLSR